MQISVSSLSVFCSQLKREIKLLHALANCTRKFSFSSNWQRLSARAAGTLGAASSPVTPSSITSRIPPLSGAAIVPRQAAASAGGSAKPSNQLGLRKTEELL